MLVSIIIILFSIVYLSITFAYFFIFYKFWNYDSVMFLIAFLFWPLIFIASLFSLPFLTFMRIIRENENEH